MSTIGGPNIIEGGLVFGYDADKRNTRFYKGEPTTNLISGTSNPILSTNGWGQTGWSGSVTLDTNENALVLTATNGWHDMNYDFGVLNQPITISFQYKFKSQQTNSGGYVLNGTSLGSYVTSFGYIYPNLTTYQTFSTTFTPTTNSKIVIGLRGLDNSGLTDVMYIKNLQVEQKNHATQFTTGTRLSTQSLIDLKRTNTIDLTNVSFDWKGSPYFYAGGNNNINMGNISTLDTNDVTIDFWLKRKNGGVVVGKHYSNFECRITDTKFGGYIGLNSGLYWWSLHEDSLAVSHDISLLDLSSKYNHFCYVISYSTKFVYFYVNGKYKGSLTNSQMYHYTTGANLYIGMRGASDGVLNGEINSLKIYNKVLDAPEVLQNYNASKGKFEEENKLNEGLVLHLDANNKNSYAGSGTTWYDLAGSNNGTLTNGVTFNNSPDSLVFDGVNDFVEIPYTSTLAPVNQITFSAWFYRTNWNDNVNGRILSKTEGGGYQLTSSEGSFVLLGYTGAIIRLNTLGTYASVKVQSSTLSSGYHHILTTFDGRYIKLYIDGVLRDTYDRGTTDTILYVSNNSLILGAEAQSGTGAAGQYMSGKMSKLKIWNRALSLQEVDQDFNNNRGRFNL